MKFGFYHNVNIVNGVMYENGERSHFAKAFKDDKNPKNRVSSTFDDFVFQSRQRLSPHPPRTYHKCIEFRAAE